MASQKTLLAKMMSNSDVWTQKKMSQQQQLLQPKSKDCSRIQQHGWHGLDLLHHKLMSPPGAVVSYCLWITLGSPIPFCRQHAPSVAFDQMKILVYDSEKGRVEPTPHWRPNTTLLLLHIHLSFVLQNDTSVFRLLQAKALVFSWEDGALLHFLTFSTQWSWQVSFSECPESCSHKAVQEMEKHLLNQWIYFSRVLGFFEGPPSTQVSASVNFSED